MNNYSIQTIYNYTIQELDNFLNDIDIKDVGDKRYRTLYYLYYYNYISDPVITSLSFEYLIKKSNTYQEYLINSKNIDDIYNYIIKSKYLCYEEDAYLQLYIHKFTYEELIQLSSDQIEKLYFLYKIEKPYQNRLTSFILGEFEPISKIPEQAYEKFNIQRTPKILDFKKQISGFFYGWSNLITPELQKEIDILGILYYYTIIDKNGFKSVLFDKEKPDLNNLPKPFVLSRHNSYQELINKYSDWFIDNFLITSLFGYTITNDYLSYGFKNINYACTYSQLPLDNQIFILLNLFTLVNPTPVDMMVYKFYSTDIKKLLISDDIYMEKRFMSTTINPNLIENSKKYEKVLHLFVPKGSQCLNFIDISAGTSNEMEVLLPPGSKFKIYKIENDRIYHAYLIN